MTDDRKGRVAGKVALVTGAASGLGAADADRLAREGARVILADVADQQGEALAATIPGAIYRSLDVRNESAWAAPAGLRQVRRQPRRYGREQRPRPGPQLGSRDRTIETSDRGAGRRCRSRRCAAIWPNRQ